MADTFSTPELSPKTTISKNVIILIALIILASIGLVITIGMQNKNNTLNPVVEQNKVTPVNTDIANNSGTNSPNPVEKEYLGKRMPEEVPNIVITKKQLESNSKRESCWTIVDGIVYNLSSFIETDLAQQLKIKDTDICGKDGTQILAEERYYPPPIGGYNILNPYSSPIGTLEQ